MYKAFKEGAHVTSIDNDRLGAHLATNTTFKNHRGCKFAMRNDEKPEKKLTSWLCQPLWKISGQIITTSAEVTLNCGLVRESPPNPLNSGLGIILICPEILVPFSSSCLTCFLDALFVFKKPPAGSHSGFHSQGLCRRGWFFGGVSRYAFPAPKLCCDNNSSYLEDHPMTCKWLITMVIVSPQFLGLFSFQMAFSCLTYIGVVLSTYPSPGSSSSK